MKKALPFIALGLCAVLLAVIVFGVVWFIKSMKEKTDDETPKQLTVEDYFEKNWPDFCPVYYDRESSAVMLQKQIDATYEQACQFGKEVYEDLALGHVGTMEVMLDGCEANCSVELSDIVISGISSDGEVIYTVHADGTLTACWEKDRN